MPPDPQQLWDIHIKTFKNKEQYRNTKLAQDTNGKESKSRKERRKGRKQSHHLHERPG